MILGIRGMKTLLFLCTANFYRSRFAEAYFNHHARERGLDWCAESRGIIAGKIKEDAVSPYTLNALDQLGIPAEFGHKDRQQLSERDFRTAGTVIALDRDKHERMLFDLYPRWHGLVDYWSIPDVDHMPPTQALLALAERVDQLLDRLETSTV